MVNVLHLIPIPHSQSKTEHFESNFTDDTLWVVSTSEAKRRLQLRNIQNVEIISTQNILRATEYWSTLFQTNCPEKQLISDSLIFVLIENWYKIEKIDVEFQDIQRFKTYCDQIFPILISSEKKIFYDWIKEDSERSRRLLGWTKTAEQFLNYLTKQNFIGSAWMLSTLAQENEIYYGPYTKYVFDLGNEIQPEEMQIILKLSETNDVTVLAPIADYLQAYRSGRTYQKLDPAYIESTASECSENRFFLRSGSVLSEVKSTTSYVREILEKGNPTHKIAIACADPESYWDLLKSHFDVEGIPVDKAVVAKATTLPYFQEWLSRIKVLIQMYTSGDLEAFLNAKSYFTQNKEAYGEFKKNFSRLYNIDTANVLLEDLKTYKPEKILSFSDFISFLYATWTNSDYRLYNKMIDALIKDFRSPLKLSLMEWSSYLSLVLSRLETSIEVADREGVTFSGPHQLDHLEYSHLIVLGCQRSAMQVTNNTPFIPEDVSKLENDLGYYLPPCEDKKVEYDILWAASAPKTEVLLSYAETDFNGDPTVVAQMWLEWSQNAIEYKPSRRARWDEVMRQAPLFAMETFDESIQNKYARENDIKEWTNLKVPYKGRFSVSALQAYQYCAFAFYTTRVLKRDEIKEFDLEIDPLFQGSFLHRILELVLLHYPNLDISEDELSKLYQDVLSSKEVSEDIRPDVLSYWMREKHRHLLMIRRFLKEEAEWRARIPQTQVATLETNMVGFIGVQDNELKLTTEETPGFYPFAAKIDRVDKDQFGNIAIYDYKTSKPADFKSFEKWPESFQVQMPLYAMGLEQGLSPEHKNASVVMASYIFLRDGTRGSGYILQGVEHGFKGAVTSTRSKQTVTPEQRDLVFTSLRTQIKDMIENVQGGQFSPVPLDEKECSTCHWRKTCRAPHLK